MDAERFDEITRRLAAGLSRRGMLKALGGAALGGTLAAGGAGATAQTCKANGKACKKNAQCCSGNCVGGTGGSTGKSEGTCQPTCAHGQVPGAGGCTCAAACFNPDLGSECFGGITTTEGCAACTAVLPDCDAGQPSCVSSADCAANEICAQGIVGNNCGVPGTNGVCVPLCAA